MVSDSLFVQQYRFVRLLLNAAQAPTLVNGEWYCWFDFFQLQDLVELIGEDYLVDGGMEGQLQYGCLFLVIDDLLERFEIEPIAFVQ